MVFRYGMVLLLLLFMYYAGICQEESEERPQCSRDMELQVGPRLQKSDYVHMAKFIADFVKVLNTSGHVEVEEVFAFDDSPPGIVVPVGIWESIIGMKIHHSPVRGPKDFKGHVVTAVSMQVRVLCIYTWCT
ncbi:hypothetical protein SK128_020522 [Halocaridina rubra]|uniref:Uncharacterized protein n=1 Tax=Halocaridina rubra TaxID=373956 RepID=A0AAN8ZUN4_HALRR